MWYNSGMTPKSKPYQVVVEWTFDTESAPRWDTFRTRKEAVAKLRQLAADPMNYGLKVVEYWTNSHAVEAR